MDCRAMRMLLVLALAAIAALVPVETPAADPETGAAQDPGPSPGPESPPAAAAPEMEREPGTPPAAPEAGGVGDLFRREAAPTRVIGKIFVDGNVRVSDSAFFNSLKLKSGDPFDERAIAEEFRRLWGLGLFDDMTVESRQRPDGTVDLVFHVQDRPLVNTVAFVGMKAITESEIMERLGQSKAEVRRGQPVDFSMLRKAEAAIEQLLAEKGYLEAQVRSRLLAASQSQREVTFYIREGSKTKIKSIDFDGNTVFKDARLRKLLKLTKEANWMTSWASSKVLYHPAKFDQDAENIRAAYRSVGYLDIALLPEIVEVAVKGKKGKGTPPEEAADEDDEFWEPPPPPAPPPEGETEKEMKKRLKEEEKARKAAQKAPKKWVQLTLPIQEGTQYRVGEITVEGNTLFTTPEIFARLPLRRGAVFNDAALKAASKRIEEDYGERGYFYVSLDPRTEKKSPIANVTLAITEDRRYYVDRIEFTGNPMTRDHVLRREVPIYETDLLNVRRLRLGVRKITQLGYWQVGQDPVVEPLPDSDRVQVELQGVETSRNEIQVGGGVSGIDGAFFQGSYATRNFLGRGEILSAYLQTGSRASRYSLNFTEPWFLGKPWTLGFSLFQRQTEYVDFKRNGRGLSVVVGRLLGPFSRLDFSYGLETVEYLPTSIGYGLPSTTTISSITTAWSRDTRNNFFRPSRGYRLSTSLEYAGDFLGGDATFVKPRLDATLFLPGLARRHYLGINVSAGWIRGLKDQPVPTFERFYLGGERTLRLFRTRSVGPERTDVDLDGNGFIDPPEDRNPNGTLDPCEDLNNNGIFEANEIDRGDCLLDPNEDRNGSGLLDTEDLNRNGILDPGEDLDGDGLLDDEDLNGNGSLDFGEDRSDGRFTAFCPADDFNMNGVQERLSGEGDFGNCRLDMGEDTNADGVLGPVFPGGDKYLVLNAEYAMPLTDTMEFVLFYDAGNAFDDGQKLQFDGMRVDYGFELRFFLPVFQAPLRLIYGYVQNPRPGEDPSNFIFSIGTTF